MNGTHTRLAVLLALSALALVACGGSSTESLVGPSGDAATLSAADKDGPEAPAGDGVCDGCDGTCDGCDGTGPGPGDGTCDGCDCTCDCTCAGDDCECACDGTGPHGPGDGNGQGT